MVFDHAPEHPSQWAAIRSVGEKLGIRTESLRRWVRQAVQEAAAGRPEAERQELATYLMQVPAAIRCSFRRPTDPSGRTVPAGLVLRKAMHAINGQLHRKPQHGAVEMLRDFQRRGLRILHQLAHVTRQRNRHLRRR